MNIVAPTRDRLTSMFPQGVSCFRCFQYAEVVVSHFNLRGQQARNSGESYHPVKKKEKNYYELHEQTT